MRSTALVLLLLVASCGGGSQSAPVEAPSVVVVPEDTRRAIEGVLERYRQAYEISGFDALSGLYSQDLDLVIVYQGQEHLGWTAVSEFLIKRLGGATSVRMSLKDVHIRELQEAAVVSATRETSMGDGSITVTEKGTLTLVLRFQEGQWMVVAEHFSYPTGRS